MFKVIGTDTYLDGISGWQEVDRLVAEKIAVHLSLSPYSGSPLGCRFFREKRIREKRVYYLVYDDLELVLLVAFSWKKDQQCTIDYIRNNLGGFREIAKEIVKN